MKKYYILLFLVITIILGVTFTVISPEFYDQIPSTTASSTFYDFKDIIKEDEEMKLLQVEVNKVQLQPTVNSTLGQVFILPQPDMPNYFVAVRSGNIPGKDYISYTVKKIPM